MRPAKGVRRHALLCAVRLALDLSNGLLGGEGLQRERRELTGVVPLSWRQLVGAYQM
jgi:hypothetical protein